MHWFGFDSEKLRSDGISHKFEGRGSYQMVPSKQTSVLLFHYISVSSSSSQ